MINKNEIALVVLTCDKYADLWSPFYSFLFKYWPDCPFKIYHASNFSSYEHPSITNIHSKQISDWSTETKINLNQIDEKYVIIIIEDYFIYKPADIELLLKSINEMEEMNALFLKIGCLPSMYNSYYQYEKIEKKPFIGKIMSNQLYRVNLQIGAWNKNLLYNLLKEGESPWQFEINGSKRSNTLPNPCLCIVEDPHKNYVHGPITYMASALTKGVWMRDAIKLCKKENIPLIIGTRKVETKFEYFFRRIYTKTPLSKRKYLDFIKSKLFHFQY